MKDVHVVHVVRTLGKSGGMERNLRRIAIELSRDGMRHSILHLDDHPDRIELPPHVPVHRVTARPRDPRMIARIWRELFAMSPTVIHARNWGAWPDTAAARLALVPRVPLVWSYHGMEASAVVRRERLKFQAMSKVTSRIFAVSDAARQLLIDSFGLERERVSVIENGVDTDRFRPADGEGETVRSGRLVVGAVGRIFKIKNLPMLMRAVKRLIEGGADIELKIAGEGPELESTRAFGASLALGDRFELRGFVEDVPGFLRGLDMFVLSSDNEANPNALLEAMSSGRACVATSVGNVGDLLDDGRAGLLVRPGDEIALAEAIGSLARDHQKRRALGTEARARIVRRYSQARMFAKYEALYREPRTAMLD